MYLCVSLLNRKDNCRREILNPSHVLSNYEPHFFLTGVFKAFTSVPAVHLGEVCSLTATAEMMITEVDLT